MAQKDTDFILCVSAQSRLQDPLNGLSWLELLWALNDSLNPFNLGKRTDVTILNPLTVLVKSGTRQLQKKQAVSLKPQFQATRRNEEIKNNSSSVEELEPPPN